ncbi:MAG: hydantoinase/oxoprolinase family protein [Candidatus Promineifilaceae bacterium]
MSRLGVDTGGTFTDFVWVDDHGRLQIHKQLSTPIDPSNAIVEGIQDINPPPASPVVHGSTVATNALLERRGARTALITTRGFGDVLAIGRQNRPDIYALVPQKPPPLVPARWRFELSERITSSGVVQEPLHEDELDQLVGQLLALDIESVAVCFLFSFLRPEHERRVREAIAARFQGEPPIHISLSCEILPQFREYERASTTVINAYIAPLMSRYLSRLEKRLGPRRLSIMQSSGGIISAAAASKEAARTVLSGPAGGVVGARYVAGLAGFDNIITFDMGGTSTDVALCPGRLPATSTGSIAGMPLHLPIIDIHTVGAGGGSLAYLDLGGALHVGPQSAGAEPGPACYGRPHGDWRLQIQGQTVPYRVTTTDANLALGRLDPDNFLGGLMQLDESAAVQNLDALAGRLDLPSPLHAAWQILQVANATMERAIRKISVERGHDPRRFTLVAFGGAGPLHACELAAQLSIPRVLIPAVPGVLSALGMLAAAPAKDYSRTVMRDLLVESDLLPWLDEQFERLAASAVSDMVGEGYDQTEFTFEPALDMRYAGQSHELTIPYAGPGFQQTFHAAHERRFGYRQPAAPLEIVNIRLKVIAGTSPLALRQQPIPSAPIPPVPAAHKQVWFAGKPHAASLYHRDQLSPGQEFNGPAIIFQYDTTTVIPPTWRAAVDRYANLLLTCQPVDD